MLSCERALLRLTLIPYHTQILLNKLINRIEIIQLHQQTLSCFPMCALYTGAQSIESILNEPFLFAISPRNNILLLYFYCYCYIFDWIGDEDDDDVAAAANDDAIHVHIA